MLAIVRNLSRTTELRSISEAQKTLVTKLVANAYRRHRIDLEVLIQRYATDLWATTNRQRNSIAFSANDHGHLALVLHKLTDDYQKLAEHYTQLAADIGFQRALDDLQLRGFVGKVHGAVVAPKPLSAQVLAENLAYLKTSLLPDLHARVLANADSSATLDVFKPRIQMYAHYLWRGAEMAYKLGLQSYFDHKKLKEVGTASSGNHGHLGVHGKVGGSAPGGFSKADFGHARMVAKITAVYNKATPEEIETGMHWFQTTNDVAQSLATKYNLPIEKTVGVIAALSPQLVWERNIEVADAFFAHPDENHGQVVNNYAKAQRIMDGEPPLTVLGSKDYQKTQNFYRNILDPTEDQSVTIDRHAVSCAMGRALQTKEGDKVLQFAKYGTYASAYRDAAAKLGILPNQLQSITWSHWRVTDGLQKPPKAKITEAWVKGLPDWLQPYEGEEGFDNPNLLREGSVDQPRDEHGRFSSGGEAYAPEEKHCGRITEIKYLPIENIEQPESEGAEVTSVSDDVARGMDYSEPVQATAFRDNKNHGETPTVALQDGNHRYAAARQTGRKYLPVQIDAVNAYGAKLNALIALSKSIEVNLKESLREGGEGSGNFDHSGRPGEVGGSEASKGAALAKVGKMHEDAKDTPMDPATIAAYTALKAQTLQQYNDLIAKGYSFEYGSKDPYSTSKEMRADVDARHTIVVYNESNDLPANHPLAELAPNGETYNTVFRGVHDLNGHYFPNHSFGPNGELGAFQAHSKMYDEKALPALAAETLAQNAWVNYGPHNPQNLALRDRPFAEQKAYAFPAGLAKHMADSDFNAAMKD